MFETFGRSNWPDPLRELRRMQDEFGRAYSTQARVSEEFPPLNLRSGERGAVLTAALPGVEPDSLEITVRQDTLTLKGERAPDVGEGDATYHRRQRRHGAIGRTIALPFSVDSDHVEARVEDGVLSLMLPRHESERPKRIEISKS